MSQSLLNNWLVSQKDVLDTIICTTAQEYFNTKIDSQSNFLFDTFEAAEEMFKLGRGEDLCYDRVSIGFVYSLWYHARRINTFLRYFSNVLVESKDEEIEIFDLGAGTGAVQWATGLVYVGMKELGLQVPRIKLVNIDNSPFMLQYHNLLWQKFRLQYQQCSDISWEYRVNAWGNSDNSNYTNSWICASYLFDHLENREAIANNFVEIIQIYKPDLILLLTSNQPDKRQHLDSIATKVKSIGYKEESSAANETIFSGNLQLVSSLRNSYRTTYSIPGFVGNAAWDDRSFTGAIFRNKLSEQLSLSEIIDSRKPIESLSIYTPSIQVRRQVELNLKQKESAKHNDRPTIIIGPAGSGKSIVLTERIKSLIEQEDYNSDLKILLTTFNKSLVRQLGEWLEQILDLDRFNVQRNDETSKFYFSSNQNSPNIHLLHFDVLPTRVGNIRGQVVLNEHARMNQVIQATRRKYQLSETDYSDVLNSHFLLDEFHRVFYGLGYYDKEIYLSQRRIGRGNNPALGKGRKREIVWDGLDSYYKQLKESEVYSFISKRLEFLESLKKKDTEEKFTHIFVDEFQDCTQSDFEIFYQLLENPNHLVLTGDLAQSVHLGRSYHIPRQAEMERRVIHRLEGSYRLPFRISECIRDLSKRIKLLHSDGRGLAPDEITPYKGAPPGARPIVVFAETVGTISQKIKDIFEAYKDGYTLSKVTIFEKDVELCNCLKGLGVNVETDSILRMKGLEKDCVLWSVRTSIEDEYDANEFIYTILTRTSGILIIALSGTISQTYQEIIGTFDVNRLIFWDQETKNRYSEFCRIPETSSFEISDD